MKNNFELSPYGNMLVYQKGYTIDDVIRIINNNQLSGLRIFSQLALQLYIKSVCLSIVFSIILLNHKSVPNLKMSFQGNGNR